MNMCNDEVRQSGSEVLIFSVLNRLLEESRRSLDRFRSKKCREGTTTSINMALFDTKNEF